jgi:hypothetical protein
LSEELEFPNASLNQLQTFIDLKVGPLRDVGSYALKAGMGEIGDEETTKSDMVFNSFKVKRKSFRKSEAESSADSRMAISFVVALVMMES